MALTSLRIWTRSHLVVSACLFVLKIQISLEEGHTASLEPSLFQAKHESEVVTRLLIFC